MKKNRLIILIEDDPDDIVLFREALKPLGPYQLQCARDGEEGLRMIKQTENIFLILCDINMPKLNGLQLKRVIEGTPELKLKSIPFIFNSTTDNEIIIREAFSLGIQGFLQKPNTLQTWTENLRALLHFWNISVHPGRLQ